MKSTKKIFIAAGIFSAIVLLSLFLSIFISKTSSTVSKKTESESSHPSYSLPQPIPATWLTGS